MSDPNEFERRMRERIEKAGYDADHRIAFCDGALFALEFEHDSEQARRARIEALIKPEVTA